MPKTVSKRLVSAAGLALTASLILATPTMAATPKPDHPATHPTGQMVTGTVASVSGSVITLTAKNGGSYAIDAANAKIMKTGATVDASAVQVGDLLMARGTLSGLSMTATTIVDGVKQRPANATNLNAKAHPGENRLLGTISAINGTSLTLTVKGHGSQAAASETVLTNGSTTVTKDQAAATFTDLVTGQNVMAVGTKDAVTGEFTASQIEIVTHAMTSRTMPGRNWNHQQR